jgi:hypothetical protein
VPNALRKVLVTKAETLPRPQSIPGGNMVFVQFLYCNHDRRCLTDTGRVGGGDDACKLARESTLALASFRHPDQRRPICPWNQ